nr:IS1-like element transposase [Escherichia coli]
MEMVHNGAGVRDTARTLKQPDPPYPHQAAGS